MFGIRHNIIFSAMAHSILLATALLAGGSSEFRKANLITVLLFDERDNSLPGKQAAITNVKQITPDRVMPKASLKTVTKLSAHQEAMPAQNPAPLLPHKAHSDIGRDSVQGMTDVEAQSNSSQVKGISPSFLNSKTIQGSSREEGEVLRWQTGKPTQSGTEPSLKQRIRDTLQSNLIYPYIARKRRMEGTVLVDFMINHRGTAEKVRVLKGSGYALLDSSAMETVVKASPFPVVNISIEVPITYRLSQD